MGIFTLEAQPVITRLLKLASTWTAAQDFDAAITVQDDGLKIENPAATYAYTITGGAITAARQLNLPVTTGTDTLMVLGLAQTVTGVLTLTTPAIGAATGTSLVLTGNLSAEDLLIEDSDASHYLTITTTSNLTAARTLTLVPGDAARTVTLSGDPTLGDWFDQAVKVASNPTFGNLTITSFAANWTNVGRTVADLGAVTTVDVNGGTVDGVTVGAAGGLSQVRVQDNGLQIENPAADFEYTIVGAAIAADRQLNLPLITGTDTLASLGLAQTFSAAQTFSEIIASAKGMSFPATQVASAGANDLDDYEEGAWTPGLTFGGAAVDMTFTSQLGRYTKVGNRVNVSGYINLSAKGSSTGSALITGLPFTIANVNGAYAGAPLWLTEITFADAPNHYGAINTTTIVLREITIAGVGTDLANTDFANTSQIMISLTYEVA